MAYHRRQQVVHEVEHGNVQQKYGLGTLTQPHLGGKTKSRYTTGQHDGGKPPVEGGETDMTIKSRDFECPDHSGAAPEHQPWADRFSEIITG